MNDTTPNGPKYTISDITIMSGVEHIRKRPQMYLGEVGAEGLLSLFSLALESCAELAKSAVRVSVVGPEIFISHDGEGISIKKHGKTGKTVLLREIAQSIRKIVLDGITPFCKLSSQIFYYQSFPYCTSSLLRISRASIGFAPLRLPKSMNLTPVTIDTPSVHNLWFVTTERRSMGGSSGACN